MWILDGSQEGWYDVLQAKVSGGPQSEGAVVVPPTQDQGPHLSTVRTFLTKFCRTGGMLGFACTTKLLGFIKLLHTTYTNIFVTFYGNKNTLI